MDGRVGATSPGEEKYDPQVDRSAQSAGSSSRMKIVMLAARASAGRSGCSRAARVDHVLGRNADDLAKCGDLKVRGAATGVVEPVRPHGPHHLRSRSRCGGRGLGGFDTVILSAGIFSTQDELANDPRPGRRRADHELTKIHLFCESARPSAREEGGRLVSSSRPSRTSAGASPWDPTARKAGSPRISEGLDHLYPRAGLITATVKPGFVRTSMTESQRPPFAGDPDDVAKTISPPSCAAPVVYAPPCGRSS